jgi:hypothetical protein
MMSEAERRWVLGQQGAEPSTGLPSADAMPDLTRLSDDELDTLLAQLESGTHVQN